MPSWFDSDRAIATRILLYAVYTKPKHATIEPFNCRSRSNDVLGKVCFLPGPSSFLEQRRRRRRRRRPAGWLEEQQLAKVREKQRGLSEQASEWERGISKCLPASWSVLQSSFTTLWVKSLREETHLQSILLGFVFAEPDLPSTD